LAGLSGLRRWRQWFINVVKRVLRHRVEAVNLRQSRGIIVLSEQSLGEVSAFRCPSSHVHLLSGGVNLLRFHPVVSKDAVRHSLGLPQDRRLLLSVRRLTPRMGLDKLIAAMPTVAARRPDVLLLIGGKGSERDRLERLIVKCGMEDHVRLIGFIPDEQLASYYGAADVFILPTAALEGFGLVTVEALACGVPVLGTPIGATPEILAPLDPRLVMPGATPDALASGILAFLEEEWPQELSVDRLRQYVERNYSWDRHIEAVEAVYRTVLQGSRLGEGKTDMRNKTEGGVTPL
jgi:glycosyltransferase involved in cell wall biosynthesis